MIPRPKPGESEDDLLKFQQEFLAKQEKSAVSVVKKPDKRKTTESSVPVDKDVVNIEGKQSCGFVEGYVHDMNSG